MESSGIDHRPENELRSATDGRAMTVAMILFFMVGFLTCLNDIIIPHLKSIFELNYMEAMLVQFAFFSSYFVFSYPGGRSVDWLGYKKTMVLGLMTMAAGAVGFIPASYVASFPVFLGALILLAAGMTTVQVAANPYVTIIGPSATASSRLNLAQAFNSVGTFIAPFVGGMFILRGAPQIAPALFHSMTAVAQQAYRQTQASSVRLPYAGMALLLALLATALGLLRLGPGSGRAQPVHHSRTGVLTQITRQEIWHHPWLLCGAFGIFTYVGAEVTIGSLLVNYMGLPQVAGLREQTAANYLMFYWGGAMIGRFIGSAILQRVNTGLLLCIVAVGPRPDLDSEQRQVGDGRHAGCRLFQFDHVPVHIHFGDPGSRPPDRQRFEPDDRVDRGRGPYSARHRKVSRSHRASAVLDRDCHLLRLYRFVRGRRDSAEGIDPSAAGNPSCVGRV
jgi:FHS family L-fucose permease-like MFS transporter